jgi:hypothetical protein
LSTGFAALDIPPFDPLLVPEVLLDYKHEATDGKMIVRNTEARGLKNIDILDLRSVPVVVMVAHSSYTEATDRGPMDGGDVNASPLSAYCRCDMQTLPLLASSVISEGHHYHHSRVDDRRGVEARN